MQIILMQVFCVHFLNLHCTIIHTPFCVDKKLTRKKLEICYCYEKAFMTYNTYCPSSLNENSGHLSGMQFNKEDNYKFFSQSRVHKGLGCLLCILEVWIPSPATPHGPLSTATKSGYNSNTKQK